MEQLTAQEIIDIIRGEDHTQLLELISLINTDKMEVCTVSQQLKNMDKATVANFSTHQIFFLKRLDYRGGRRLWMSNHREEDKSPFELEYDKAPSAGWASLNGINKLPKEDLIFLTDYHKSQWRKANPSRTNTKGTQLSFKMDMFALTIFKKSITKPFLRTEAKNFLLKVNEAYNASAESPKEIAIRNKFYALILDNAPVHTKAMINVLIPTPLRTRHNSVYINYQPEADEALAVEVGHRHRELVCISTGECITNYVGDLVLVTHNRGTEDDRTQERTIGAASALATMYDITNNEVYLALTTRMLQYSTKEQSAEVLNTTSAIGHVRTILKEQ